METISNSQVKFNVLINVKTSLISFFRNHLDSHGFFAAKDKEEVDKVLSLCQMINTLCVKSILMS